MTDRSIVVEGGDVTLVVDTDQDKVRIDMMLSWKDEQWNGYCTVRLTPDQARMAAQQLLECADTIAGRRA